MKISEVMSTDIKTCSPEQPLEDVARLMWEHDCGCVPVVDGEGRVVGMLTDRDICMAAYFRGIPLRDIRVRDAMAQVLVTCGAEDSVQAAASAMKRSQVRRLPVTDLGGRLIGLLSLNDIAREAVRERSARTPEVQLQDVAITLSAIGQRRAIVEADGRHAGA